MRRIISLLLIARWCNRVAAEILVPAEYLKMQFHPNEELPQQIARLARYFKVSTIVIIRRIHDLGFLTYDEFTMVYHVELERLLAIMKGSGGNFYLTQGPSSMFYGSGYFGR